MRYHLLLVVVRAFLLATGHRVHRIGTARLPHDGPVVLAINHTGYLEFLFLGLEMHRRDRRRLRFMGKVELGRSRLLRWLMAGCGVILVDRSAGAAAYEEAVGTLRDGEVVAIFPEATISRSFELKSFKSGAARMALATGAPIVPAVVWGSQRIATKGRPRHLGRTRTPLVVGLGDPIPAADSADVLTDRLHDAMEMLLDEARTAYGPHPRGEDWVPAAMGGSAPTLAEADAMDAADHR